MIELGGNITLVGFKEMHHTELVVVKKMVGNYVRKIAGNEQVNELRLVLKPIHKTDEASMKYDLKATLDLNGKIYNSEVIEFNLYVGIDEILKKLESQVEHRH
jgi:ribosome-associated translation inhibitor RaiA